ncbi:MAG: hypothetical protein H8K07_07725 [Nitrospira sp.]|jgi:hypothetical protein|nr:hypothetical protein [Nitrospira sp.]MDI3463395.1 hypothetical protein [Nitrospira sp.]
MNGNHACDVHRDASYSNVCQVCGVPMDAGYFDVASIKDAPKKVGDEVELARYELNPQYCGTLLYFMQYAEDSVTTKQVISHTPGYQWVILCNNQPRAPYLPTELILNPWGANALRIELRLEEGCTLRFVVRRVATTVSPELSQVGGRLLGRTWYNTIYGGTPNRL